MSTISTQYPNLFNTDLPADLRKEFLFMGGAKLIAQMSQQDWYNFFTGKDLQSTQERVLHCDDILKHYPEMAAPQVAAWLANAVAQCGGSNHVCWDQIFKNRDLYSYTSPIHNRKPYIDSGIFWDKILAHGHRWTNVGISGPTKTTHLKLVQTINDFHKQLQAVPLQIL